MSRSADPVPRRRLLRSAAALAATGAVGSTAAAADATELSVLTRNLYVGVDLSRLVDVEDIADLRAVAGDLLAEIRAHPYDARVAGIAGEVASSRPDVVCVQEAALIRTRDPSQFDGDHDPGAETVEVDLLSSLADRLAARGLDYDVAATVVTNDVEVPADADDGQVDLRLTNRVAVLVREPVTVAGRRSSLFDAGVPVPIEGVDVTIRRGYAGVDLEVAGRPVTVLSTHLESFLAGIRDAQAAELTTSLPAARPAVVAGDFNAGPDSSPETYRRLRSAFEDAHAARRPAAAGPTCCHADGLRNDVPTLTRRVDAVLYRGGVAATAVERVGAAPADRVRAEVGSESVRVWPSDHAGVLAAVTVPESATETPTRSPTRSPTPSATTDAGTPGGPDGTPEPQDGFGLLAGVLAGASAALAARRRRGDDGE